MTQRFLRFAQLKQDKGIPWSRMHVDRLEKADRFPKRVQLGESTVVWVEAEIDEFIAAKVAGRRAA